MSKLQKALPFKYYFVRPPGYNDEPSGEDDREFFTSAEEAVKSFNEWVRKLRRFEKEIQTEGWKNLTDDFAYAYVQLGFVWVTPTKLGILRALNEKMPGELLREYPAEKKNTQEEP